MTDSGQRRGPYLIWLAILVGFGVYLRIEGLTGSPLFGDEYHSLASASAEPGVILTSFDRFGSHVLTPLLQHASLTLLGPDVWTLRLAAVVPGILALLLMPILAGRLADRPTALVATALLAVSPMHVYYSRFARPYALEVLLAMGVVYAAVRVMEERKVLSAWRLTLVLAVALLLYTHLASAGFVAAVAAAFTVASFLRKRSWCSLWIPIVTFGLAGVLALLMYLPVFENVQDYLGKERALDDRGPLSWLEVTSLLGGGVAAGVTLSLLAIAGLLLALRHKPGTASLLAAAVLGPLALLLATRPFGMAYAYARYLIAGLPFLLLLAAIPLGRVLHGRVAHAGALSLGLALLLNLTGPGSVLGERTLFRNTYLAMFDLPAFDDPWPESSALYGRLAEDPGVERVIELPLMRSRTVLLLRNHQLRHGKQVLIGVGSRGLGPRLEGQAYVHLDRPGWRARADWLIVHRAAPAELEAYGAFVYGREFGGAARGLMARHRRMPPNFPDAAPLPADLGPPDYEDEFVAAWRLRRP